MSQLQSVIKMLENCNSHYALGISENRTCGGPQLYLKLLRLKRTKQTDVLESILICEIKLKMDVVMGKC